MRKAALIILGLLQFSLTLKSQEKIQLYFNSNWEVTSKDKAVYIREAEYDLQNFTLNGNVTDRDLKDNIVMDGNYLYGRRNGEFNFYYRTGKIESKGVYLNNIRAGKWAYYYPDGRLKQSLYFNNLKEGDLRIGEYNDKNGKQLIKNGNGKWLNDSIWKGQIDKANLLRIKGKFKDSLKTGVWKLIRIPDNKLLQTERFRKGKFKIGRLGFYNINDSSIDSQTGIGKLTLAEMRSGYFREDLRGDLRVGITDDRLENKDRKFDDLNWNSESGLMVISLYKKESLNKIPDEYIIKFDKTEKLTLDSNVFPKSLLTADLETFFKTVSPTEIRINNRKAMYPYGDNILIAFISGNIHYPIEASRNKIRGTVFVNVAIDSMGNTKEIKIFKGVSEDIDKEAMRVITLINKWLPAKQEGKAVESTITIPVKFNLKD